MNKKEWYKKWWGVILAILFLPLFAFWWVWKKSKFSPKFKKISLIIIGFFDVLIYGILIYASIVSVGTPVFNTIKSPTDQQTISVSGYGVEGGSEVKLLLNDSESQKVKSDSAGKFSFANISLNEGKNTLKASTLNSKGKFKESIERVIVYQKSQPKEETKSAEPSSQTSTPSPSKTPASIAETPTPSKTPASIAETPKQENIYDKLWKALDESRKTRDGYSIAYNDKSQTVTLTRSARDYYDETDTVRAAYTNLVSYGMKTFQIEGVNRVEVILKGNFTDQYGKSSEEDAVDLIMKKDEFNKYDWNNLVNTNIYKQMTNSCDYYYVHPAIFKAQKTDKLYLVL